tara:strand:- start:45 stop:857 length:813 start_codon:yes stop_codon:yes gene_type:complete
MSRFGWAYVNCEESGSHTKSEGVSGSVMFMTDPPNQFISGSDMLMYKYVSGIDRTGDTPQSSLILTGTLYVRGAVSASHFHYEDIQRIDSSGSTRFGNSKDDSHIRTGSLFIGNTDRTTAFAVNLNSSQSINVGGFRMNYRSLTPLNEGEISYYSASMADHLLGVKGDPGSVNSNGYPAVIYLPSATSSSPPIGSLAGGSGGGTYSPMSGAVLTIKDEFTGSRIPLDACPGAILVSASAGETIDGQAYYEMTGTMTAINIYSNGSNWFVF